MTANTSIHIEEGGDVSARLGANRWLHITVRMQAREEYSGGVTVTVYPDMSPELHARLCLMFGLEQTAPAVESEDGEPAGNEPERAMEAQAKIGN